MASQYLHDIKYFIMTSNKNNVNTRTFVSILMILLFFISSSIGVFAQSNDQTIIIKTKINLANIPDIEKFNYLKVVGYLNGEGKIKYIDLDKFFLSNENERSSNGDNDLVVNLEFNKKNDISEVIFDDEYFVCAYFMNDISNNSNNENSIVTINEIPLYDCDEGNIGNTDKDSVKLFYTSKKYDKSLSYNLNRDINDLDETSKDIKITIKVPIYDSKNIELMNVVAMIRGEYQIKTIDVEDELNYKKDGKSTDKMIFVPFTFERETEIGDIQKGDMFFGCVTSDDFPNQNSDCEKRLLQKLEKSNKLCARKDNSC
ncbi:MAG: hypothetical protein ACPKQO_00435 [Nitrososphaeraceae archaeon]